MRNPTTGVSFNTVSGDTINIAADQSKLTVTKADGTVLMSDDGTDSSGRRRLGFFSALMTSGSFTMMQAGGVNLGMYFDTTAPTVTAGEFDMDIPTAPAGTKYAVAIDTAYSGFILRFFFDRVTLKSNGEIGLGNAAAIPLPVELSCLDNSGILGSVQRTAVV